MSRADQKTAELAQAGQLRELKQEMALQVEEEIKKRIEEYKEEVATRLAAFLRLHDSLGQERVRSRMSPEEVFEVREKYDDLRLGKLERVLAYDRTYYHYYFKVLMVDLGQLDTPVQFGSSSMSTSDGASSPEPLETPQDMSLQKKMGGINFLQQDEISIPSQEFQKFKPVEQEQEVKSVEVEMDQVIEEKEDKKVDWAEEVEDDGPIFATTTTAEIKPQDDSSKPILAPEVASNRGKARRGRGKAGLPPRPQSARGNGNGNGGKSQASKVDKDKKEDGFEEVVKKQGGRGRGGGNGNGRGRGGITNTNTNGNRNGTGRGRGKGGQAKPVVTST
jgi:hypothetical protein